MKWKALAVCITICIGIPLHAHAEPPEGWRPLWKIALLPMAINVSIQEDSETGLSVQLFRDIVELSFRRNNIRMMDSEWSPEFFVQFRALEIFREDDGTAVFSYALDVDVRHRVSTSCLYMGNNCTVLGLLWTYGWIGFGTGDDIRRHAREALSEAADKFSLDYLRAQEEWSQDRRKKSRSDD